MKDSIKQAIERQIGNEFEAAYTYLSMSAWFEAESLPGMAHWMLEQSKEEVNHAIKLFTFLLDRNQHLELHPVPAPPSSFDSPVAAFEAALQHERRVTAQINELYELSLQERDYTAQVLLQWFVTEQLEEEKSTGTLVERLKMVEGSRSALLILDSELGNRSGDPHS